KEWDIGSLGESPRVRRDTNGTRQRTCRHWLGLKDCLDCLCCQRFAQDVLSIATCIDNDSSDSCIVIVEVNAKPSLYLGKRDGLCCDWRYYWVPDRHAILPLFPQVVCAWKSASFLRF